ncbi:SMI1/KNR4 family protein [Nocardioides sp. YR527]|uniref:SMI1/KNR4 family protein n=1 Tax=Nocardioides sp. YR527 TaxID=1881028 RepID=UPI0015A49F97|nr:SMI1/KNR4 family protein [Nocardioides sp. YR527]
MPHALRHQPWLRELGLDDDGRGVYRPGVAERMNTWDSLIQDFERVQQHAARHDGEGLIRPVPAQPGASEEVLAEVERVLGQSLDTSFRAFLHAADGWENFFYSLRIFSTQFFKTESSTQEILDLIFVERDLIEDAIGVRMSECLPIGMNEYGTDSILLMLDTSDSYSPGAVIWHDNGQIYVRCEDFEEFFTWMTRFQAGEIDLGS